MTSSGAVAHSVSPFPSQGAATAPDSSPDQDPHRPGIQGLIDLWRVDTSEGALLLFAPTADLAQRDAVHTLVTAGQSPAPSIRNVALATGRDVSVFLEGVATLLGIQPGAVIPHHLLPEAKRMLKPPSALRLATYRVLTERDTADATPLPPAAEAVPLRVPAEYRLDIARGVYFLRNLMWVMAWVAVAVAPFIVGAFYWFGIRQDWWHPVGWQVGESLITNRGAVTKGVIAPVAGVSFVWALLWFAMSHRPLFARMNMWPDRGGSWDRDQ